MRNEPDWGRIVSRCANISFNRSILGARVDVFPGTSDVYLLDPIQFAANVVGLADARVTRSATGGQLTAGGLWTAPNVVGVYKVTATSVVRPDLNGSATITVRGPGSCTLESQRALLDGSYDVIGRNTDCRYPNGTQSPFGEFLDGGGSLNLTNGVMTFSDGVSKTTGSGNYTCSGFGFSSSPPAPGASKVAAFRKNFDGQLTVFADLAHPINPLYISAADPGTRRNATVSVSSALSWSRTRP